MIPLVDVAQVLADLEAWGWRPFKIDMACGFSGGYVAQIRCGNVRDMAHARAVRLYNFWEDEAIKRGVAVPSYGSPLFHVERHLQIQEVSVTT